MSNKTLLNLGIILVLGIALTIGRNLLNKYQQNQPNEYLKVVQSINKDAITEINFKKANQNLSLFKKNDVWKIATQSADPEKINDLFKYLLPENSPLLIAESSDLIKSFEADEAQGINLDLKTSDNNKISFIIGKETGTSTVIALPGMNKAYAVKNLDTISLNPDQWYDLTIVNIQANEVKKISFERGINSFTLSQNENKDWQFLGEDTKTNSDAVRNIINLLNPLKARELAFAQKQAEFNMNTPTFNLIITDKNDQNTNLEFFQGANDWLVKKGNQFFVLDNDLVGKFNITKEKLILTN